MLKKQPGRPDKMDDQRIQSQATGSRLLQELQNRGLAQGDEQEWRRSKTRSEAYDLTRIELRRKNGRVSKTRLHNASEAGVCVICPSQPDLYETVLLRLMGDNQAYESFRVVHVTTTIGSYKVGMVWEPEED